MRQTLAGEHSPEGQRHFVRLRLKSAPANVHSPCSQVGAREFRAGSSVGSLSRLGVQQRRIRAGRPTANGHVERLQQTILEECWRPSFARSLVPKLTALQADLRQYLGYYNFDRAHTGRLTRGGVPGEIVYGARPS